MAQGLTPATVGVGTCKGIGGHPKRRLVWAT